MTCFGGLLWFVSWESEGAPQRCRKYGPYQGMIKGQQLLVYNPLMRPCFFEGVGIGAVPLDFRDCWFILTMWRRSLCRNSVRSSYSDCNSTRCWFHVFFSCPPLLGEIND